MKMTTKELKELHEWSNALEQLAQMSKTVEKSLSEVKRIDGLMDGLMTSIKYVNLDEKCAYEKLESHFKEQIEKARLPLLGRVWVSKGTESRFVTKEVANELLQQGFVYGRPFQKRIKGKKYLYNGEYLTIPEISEMCKIDKTILFARIRLGWSIEKATTTSKIAKDDKKGKYLYNGEYLNLTYISKKVGIERELLRSRLRCGYSLEEAINFNPKRKVLKNG